MKRKLGPGPAEIRFFAIAKAERGVVLAATLYRKARQRLALSKSGREWEARSATMQRRHEALLQEVARYEAARKGAKTK